VIRTTARVSSQRNEKSRQDDGGEKVRRSMSERKENSKRIVTDNTRKREYAFSNKVNSRRTIERNRKDLRRKISRTRESVSESFNDDSTENIDTHRDVKRRFEKFKTNRRNILQKTFYDTDKIVAKYDTKNQREIRTTAQPKREAEDPLKESKQQIQMEEEKKNEKSNQRIGAERKSGAFEEKMQYEGKIKKENTRTKRMVTNGNLHATEIRTKRNGVRQSEVREDFIGQLIENNEKSEEQKQTEDPPQKKVTAYYRIMDFDILPSYDTPTMKSTVVQAFSLVITVGYLVGDVRAGKC